MQFFNGSFGDDSILVPDKEANLIIESCLVDGLNSEELNQVLEDTNLLNYLKNEEVVTERTIVRMDKKARLNSAYRTAIFTVARRKKDPKFKKLLTLWRMERSIEAYLEKRYHNEAMKIAKASIRNKSLSGASGQHAAKVKKAIATAKSQLNAGSNMKRK